MKYAVLLCLAAIGFDALAMHGRYRDRAGHAVAAMSASVGQSLWGRLG